MAHFAELNGSNIVQRVVVIDNAVLLDAPGMENEAIGQVFCARLWPGSGTWKQTSYNARFRKNYAGIGYTWRDDLDGFVPPSPGAGWTLDDVSCKWERD